MEELDWTDLLDTLVYIRASLQVVQSACNNEKEILPRNIAMYIEILDTYIDHKIESLNEVMTNQI